MPGISSEIADFAVTVDKALSLLSLGMEVRLRQDFSNLRKICKEEDFNAAIQKWKKVYRKDKRSTFPVTFCLCSIEYDGQSKVGKRLDGLTGWIPKQKTRYRLKLCFY